MCEKIVQPLGYQHKHNNNHENKKTQTKHASDQICTDGSLERWHLKSLSRVGVRDATCDL